VRRRVILDTGPPMSLADACLVRMSEQHMNSPVLTLDADFRTYRRHARHVVPTLMP
jgi:predicted nucleic acid-binding protein